MQPDLLSLIESCAGNYRLGREAQAASLLQQVIVRFTDIMEVNPDIISAEIESAVAGAMVCQERQDWIGLADELQFKLQPALKNKMIV